MYGLKRGSNASMAGSGYATEAGSLQFRGGGAFRGYYKDPQATRDTILQEGWVRTGDLGRLDAEGWLTYLGRLKDVLRVGGESVAVLLRGGLCADGHGKPS